MSEGRARLLRFIATVQLVAAIWVISALRSGVPQGAAKVFLIVYAAVAVISGAGLFAKQWWAEKVAGLLHLAGGAAIYIWMRHRLEAGGGVGVAEILCLITSAAFMGFLMRPRRVTAEDTEVHRGHP